LRITGDELRELTDGEREKDMAKTQDKAREARIDNDIVVDAYPMEMLELFKALSDDNRLRVVFALADGPRNAGDLSKAIGMPQPTTSHHLNLLRLFGVVNSTRKGREIFYTLIGKSGAKGISFKVDGATVLISRQ
jgi:DNA-binding transcriptional ArsR family regulator